MSVDPIKDGMNWYIYAANNPIVMVDPDGLRIIEVHPGVFVDDTNNEVIKTPDGWEVPTYDTAGDVITRKNMVNIKTFSFFEQFVYKTDGYDRDFLISYEDWLGDTYNSGKNLSIKQRTKAAEIYQNTGYIRNAEANAIEIALMYGIKPGDPGYEEAVAKYIELEIEAYKFSLKFASLMTVAVMWTNYFSKAFSTMQANRITNDVSGIGKTISTQKQMRHVQGTKLWNEMGQKSYFKNTGDAQKVLDAFHGNKAQILGTNAQGNPIIKVNSVTGFNNSPGAGYLNQPTNVFMIKGTKSVSVVPWNPTWGN